MKRYKVSCFLGFAFIASLAVSFFVGSHPLVYAAEAPPTQHLPGMDNGVYLTVSGGSVDESGANTLFAPASWVKIYSKTGNNANVFIDQAGGTCDGVKKIAVVETNANESKTTASHNGGTINGCTGGPLAVSILSSYFHQSSVTGHEGLFVALLRIRLDVEEPNGSNPLSSFRAYTNNNGVGLGYWGTYEQGKSVDSDFLTTPEDKESVTAFLGRPSGSNTDDYTLQFKPPCDAVAAADKTVWIKWFDDDYGRPYQPSNMVLNIYEADEDSAGIGSIVNTINFKRPGGFGGLEGFGGGGAAGRARLVVKKEKKYTIVWSNITRENGIAIYLPFDSGNFYSVCKPPPPKKWTLDPGTTVSHQIGGYTAQYANPTSTDTNPSFNARKQANVARAKAAFDDARFKHYVNERDGRRDAFPGEHHWKVQFKMVRAGGAESAIHDKDPPLNNLTAKVEAAGPAAILVDNNGHVVNDSRANVNSQEMKFLFRNDDDTEYRNPVIGDQYCERVNNTSFDADKGTIVNDPSSWKCVTLPNGGPPCLEEPWTVGASASVTGDGDPADAWPGQNFNFNYAFKNNGPADNTKSINFYHNSPSPTYSQVLGNWNPSYPLTITQADGGRTISDQMAYEPTTSAGADNCGIFGNNTVGSQVTVPYYFHLKPSSDGLPDKTQQGDPVTPKLSVNLPELDSQGDLTGEAASDDEYGIPGRPHTYSSPTNWRIIEFKTTDINSAKNAIPKNRSGGTGDCGEMGGFGIAGFTGCGNVSAGNQVFGIGTADFSYTRPPGLDPVGTNVCYVGVVSAPTHTGSPGSRYSNVSCTTIVKSPKVQFLNGDLTVGRHRLTDGGTPCAAPESTASIQATGAPAGASLIPGGASNLYGSWVEYGAFASGGISGFGTAAYANPSAGNEKRLMFGNTPGLGSYSYASNCLSNPFDLVKTDVNDLTPDADNLRMNEYFPAHTDDKTGYVSTGKNITISPPAASPYSATVTVRAAAQGINVGPDHACPTMKVTLLRGDGTPISKDQPVCDTTPQNYVISFPDLGPVGYKGPQGLKVEFTNDYYGNGPTGFEDRNLLFGNITVKFDQNGSSSTFNPVDVDPAKTRRIHMDVPNNGCYEAPESVVDGMLWIPQDGLTSNGYCVGYDLSLADLAGIVALPPPPGGLDDGFTAFKGRDIILYAKKNGNCGAPNAGGTITVGTDINYAKTGYGDISELPRIILLADCKIIIEDTVKRVDAWLIAKDAVETCSAATGNKFTDRTVTQGDCSEQLVVNGPVQANRLLLWRTHGADLTTAERAEAAEIFNLRPDSLLSTYSRGRDAGKPQTIYQTDLPPLY